MNYKATVFNHLNMLQVLIDSQKLISPFIRNEMNLHFEMLHSLIEEAPFVHEATVSCSGVKNWSPKIPGSLNWIEHFQKSSVYLETQEVYALLQCNKNTAVSLMTRCPLLIESPFLEIKALDLIQKNNH